MQSHLQRSHADLTAPTMQHSAIDAHFTQKGANSEKENQDLPPDKQPVLANISVNASAHFLHRSDLASRAIPKAMRTDSFSRHKAQKLEIRFCDFYKSNKEFKLVQDDERKYLLEDLFETDKCYHFATSKVEIHPKIVEGLLTRRQKRRSFRTVQRSLETEARRLHRALAARRFQPYQSQSAFPNRSEQHRQFDERTRCL